MSNYTFKYRLNPLVSSMEEYTLPSVEDVKEHDIYLPSDATFQEVESFQFSLYRNGSDKTTWTFDIDNGSARTLRCDGTIQTAKVNLGFTTVNITHKTKDGKLLGRWRFHIASKLAAPKNLKVDVKTGATWSENPRATISWDAVDDRADGIVLLRVPVKTFPPTYVFSDDIVSAHHTESSYAAENDLLYIFLDKNTTSWTDTNIVYRKEYEYWAYAYSLKEEIIESLSSKKITANTEIPDNLGTLTIKIDSLFSGQDYERTLKWSISYWLKSKRPEELSADTFTFNPKQSFTIRNTSVSIPLTRQDIEDNEGKIFIRATLWEKNGSDFELVNGSRVFAHVLYNYTYTNDYFWELEHVPFKLPNGIYGPDEKGTLKSGESKTLALWMDYHTFFKITYTWQQGE